MNIVSRFFRFVGPLRAMLMLLTASVIACAPFADGTTRLGWMLGPTVIAPTLMAMLAFSLPLDMTMTRVFMLDKSGAERERYRRILWMEGAMLAALLAAWAPFVVRLVGK